MQFVTFNTCTAFRPNFYGQITLSRVITYYRYHCQDNQSLNLLQCSLRQITNRWMWIRCPNKLKEMQEGSNHSNRVRVNYQALLQCTVTEGREGWGGRGGGQGALPTAGEGQREGKKINDLT